MKQVTGILISLVLGILSALHVNVNGLKVLVTGASGKLGSLVVKELAKRADTDVIACVRDEEKAKGILGSTASVSIRQFDLERTGSIASDLCKDVDHVIWCAAGGVQVQKSAFDKFLDIFRGDKKPIDIEAVEEICRVLGERENGKFVMCSSAGVTRPTWSDEKKKKLIGASDIPIVRLNPGNILGTKLDSEEIVRNSNANYCVVRPCGLNDNHPSGRPVLTQGDVAVGRINRADVASLLVNILFDNASDGKTFEAISIPEYPKPLSYTEQLSKFKTDNSGGLDESAVESTYAIMQQLVPGEQLAPQKLAMGQTYEQLDKGETGRLGVRGEEVLPQRLGGDNEPNADVGIKKVPSAPITKPEPKSAPTKVAAPASGVEKKAEKEIDPKAF